MRRLARLALARVLLAAGLALWLVGGPGRAQEPADPVAALRADPGIDLSRPVPAALSRAALIALDPGFRNRPAAGSPITRYLARTLLPPTTGGTARLRAEEDVVRALADGLTPDEILAAWSQRAWLGRGCIGVEAAAGAYLQGGAAAAGSDLRSALGLMALLPAPSRLLRDPAAHRARFDELVAGGAAVGLLSGPEAAALLAAGPAALDSGGGCSR